MGLVRPDYDLHVHHRCLSPLVLIFEWKSMGSVREDIYSKYHHRCFSMLFMRLGCETAELDRQASDLQSHNVHLIPLVIRDDLKTSMLKGGVCIGGG